MGSHRTRGAKAQTPLRLLFPAQRGHLRLPSARMPTTPTQQRSRRLRSHAANPRRPGAATGRRRPRLGAVRSVSRGADSAGCLRCGASSPQPLGAKLSRQKSPRPAVSCPLPSRPPPAPQRPSGRRRRAPCVTPPWPTRILTDLILRPISSGSGTQRCAEAGGKEARCPLGDLHLPCTAARLALTRLPRCRNRAAARPAAAPRPSLVIGNSLAAGLCGRGEGRNASAGSSPAPASDPASDTAVVVEAAASAERDSETSSTAQKSPLRTQLQGALLSPCLIDACPARQRAVPRFSPPPTARCPDLSLPPKPATVLPALRLERAAPQPRQRRAQRAAVPYRQTRQQQRGRGRGAQPAASLQRRRSRRLTIMAADSAARQGSSTARQSNSTARQSNSTARQGDSRTNTACTPLRSGHARMPPEAMGIEWQPGRLEDLYRGFKTIEELDNSDILLSRARADGRLVIMKKITDLEEIHNHQALDQQDGSPHIVKLLGAYWQPTLKGEPFDGAMYGHGRTGRGNPRAH